MHPHCVAVDLPHETGFRAAMRLIDVDQPFAEFGLEYVRQPNDGSRQVETNKPCRGWQTGDIAERGHDVADHQRTGRP